MSEPIDMDELKAKALRAAEVLKGTGWVFDEFIKGETQALLATLPHDAPKREEHYHLIRATAEVKGRLIEVANSYNVEKTLAERRNPA